MLYPTPSRTFVLGQLNQLSPRWGLTIQDRAAWIRCPYHKNGNESTPSMVVNLEDKVTSNGTFLTGSAKCYGCGQFVPFWNKLAQELKLSLDLTTEEKIRPIFTDQTDGALLGQNNYLPKLTTMVPWNPDNKWRTISGKILSNVDARLYDNYKRKKQMLFLPTYVNGEYVGGISANLKKEGKRNYFNSPGPWIKHSGLYPYDYAKQLIKRKKYRTLVIVEGPRDALRLLQYGIPAVAILGSNNWSDYKAELVMMLALEFLITAFDPDEAGLKATKAVNGSLRDELTVKRFKFSENTDPGNAPIEIIKKLKRFIV